jgi:acyl carrier protein
MIDIIKEKVLKIIEDSIEKKIERNIELDEDYINKFCISSIEYIRIIVGIEEEFKIWITDEQLYIMNFNTLSKVISFLKNEQL